MGQKGFALRGYTLSELDSLKYLNRTAQGFTGLVTGRIDPTSSPAGQLHLALRGAGSGQVWQRCIADTGVGIDIQVKAKTASRSACHHTG